MDFGAKLFVPLATTLTTRPRIVSGNIFPLEIFPDTQIVNFSTIAKLALTLIMVINQQ